MIDFHSHILPAIDDGARDEEETYALLAEAEAAGFDTVISTSHYIKRYYEADVKKRKEIVENINQVLKEQSLNVKVHLGNEIYITNDIIELLKDKKVTPVEGTKYVLFEMPINSKPLNMYDFVYDLIGNGYSPILAHPERYSFVQSNPDIIVDLINKDVLMQVNYGSIIGYYGERAKILARKFLECNMVHFLGSDVHREKTIYKKVPRIINILKEVIGEKKLEKLTTLNAKNVLNNKEVETYKMKKMQFNMVEKIKLKF